MNIKVREITSLKVLDYLKAIMLGKQLLLEINFISLGKFFNGLLYHFWSVLLEDNECS